MRIHNPNPEKNIWSYDPSSNNYDSISDSNIYDSNNSQPVKKGFSPLLIGSMVGLVGIIWFWALASNNSQKYQEKCVEGVSSTWEKIINCTTYQNNWVYAHTSYPYVFWLNSRGWNYTNNNGVYERVWSVKKSYWDSNTYSNWTSTTKKTSLWSSWKSYGWSTS